MTQLNQSPQQTVNKVTELSKVLYKQFALSNESGCALHYEEFAMLNCNQGGCYIGQEEIQTYWHQLLAKGVRSVQYLGAGLNFVTLSSIKVSAKWQLTNGHTLHSNENWVLQADNSFKLVQHNLFHFRKTDDE
jgi:hypothetical protein